MKVIVISDSHGNIANLRHVMGFAKKMRAGAVIHCGDWDSAKTVNSVLSFGIPLFSVLGNADINPEVERILSSQCKKFERIFLNLKLDGRRIGVCHYSEGLEKNVREFDIGFCGHTHKKKEEVYEGKRIINPGALSQTQTPSFLIYDTKRNAVEFIDIENG